MIPNQNQPSLSIGYLARPLLAVDQSSPHVIHSAFIPWTPPIPKIHARQVIMGWYKSWGHGLIGRVPEQVVVIRVWNNSYALYGVYAPTHHMYQLVATESSQEQLQNNGFRYISRYIPILVKLCPLVIPWMIPDALKVYVVRGVPEEVPRRGHGFERYLSIAFTYVITPLSSTGSKVALYYYYIIHIYCCIYMDLAGRWIGWVTQPFRSSSTQQAWIILCWTFEDVTLL